jgi:hypothetical protein
MHCTRSLLHSLLLLPLACPWGIAQQITATVASPGTAVSPDTDAQLVWVVFPQTRIFPRMYASALTHQFGFSKDFSSALVYGSIGSQIPVLQAEVNGTTLQAGAGATVLTSLLKKTRLLQVVTVDFLVEFPLDIKLSERLSLRTGYGHFSAHFADDGIEILGKSSVNYAKDYVILLGSWHIPLLDATFYAGGHWDYHALPEEDSHWLVQGGMEAGNIALLPEVLLYAALDIQWRSEVAWATTQSYQCGLRLFPRRSKAFRIAYTYRTGFDERGQFYRQQTAAHLAGVYLDF